MRNRMSNSTIKKAMEQYVKAQEEIREAQGVAREAEDEIKRTLISGGRDDLLKIHWSRLNQEINRGYFNDDEIA